VFAGGAAAQTAPPERVVYHLDRPEPGAQRAGLRKIQNHLNAKGAHRLDIIVVVRGEAVDMFRDIDANRGFKDRVRHLKAEGVRFEVCAASMARRGLDLEDLYEVEPEDIVPNGLERLVRLQEAGYTYIKP
jgi:intracellular sulfur oxidation DsrE/DsrF family protein